MSDTPQGPGWWLASDGKYYPPQPLSPPPGAPVQPPGAPVQPPSGGSGRAVLVVVGLVVVLGLLVAAVGGALVLLGRDAADEVTASRDSGGSVPTTTAELGGGSANGPDAEVEVTDTGFTVGEGFGGELSANAGAVLENVGSDMAVFFEVVFTFRDDGGRTVGTETSYVYALEPGATGHAAVDGVSLQGTATSVEATAVLDDTDLWSGRAIPVEVTRVGTDEFFGLEVSGTASNDSGAPVQGANVQCVVLLDGDVVGGTSAILDTIPPGGEVAWEAFTFSDYLRGDAAECSGAVYD